MHWARVAVRMGFAVGSARLAARRFGSVLLLLAGRRAQAPGLGASVELVDPKVSGSARTRATCRSQTKRARASKTSGRVVRKKLGEPAGYTYFPQVIGFLPQYAGRAALRRGDGRGGWRYLMQTTNPYYLTTYALVFRPGTDLTASIYWRTRRSR